MPNKLYVDAREKLLVEEGFSDGEKNFLKVYYTATETDQGQARLISEFRLVQALIQQAEAQQQQAESNDRYGKKMLWLTIALFVAAAVEALSTFYQAISPH